jgi:hypothetical protein
MFALSKIQDFFENHNLYTIYLLHMIAKHQLISSSMNMLAHGVGSRARGIPSAISARSGDNEETFGSSVALKSSSATSSARKMKAGNDGGKNGALSKCIWEHATRLHVFAKAKKESTHE